MATGATSESLGGRFRRWWRRGVRTSSLNAIIGIFLLVPSGLLSQTFFAAFHHGVVTHEFWRADDFGYFMAGALSWTLAFFAGIGITGAVWPLHVYVLSHEMTHAVWIWLARGRVLEKKIWADDGGYIVTDTNNFWIALVPYFYPFYSLVVVVCYSVASIFYDVAGSTATFLLMNPLQWLFFLLGLTWAFHLTFTIWMIPKGQSDLAAHGTFFSLVVIYLMNVVFLSLAVIVVAEGVSFESFGRDLYLNTEDFSEWSWRIIRALWGKIFA